MSSVNGARELSEFFHELDLRLQQEVSEIIEGTLQDIEMEAIRNAPGGGDRIRTENGSQSQEQIARGRGWIPINQAISYRMYNKYEGEVAIDPKAGDVAIWVEMGTGQSAKFYLATVEPEWRAYAMLYYINGKGTIIAQPYLLPAFNKYQGEAVKELKELLKNALK